MPRSKLLHISFLLIIIGGILTWQTSVRGSVHLRPGVEVTEFVDSEGNICKLPFTLILKEFQTDFYPGMSFPRDFRSMLLIDNHEVVVSMNHIGRVGAWRIYQQSFDSEGGSVLMLSRDPWGIFFVYIGFVLFALSGIPMLFGRKALCICTLIVSLNAMADTMDERQLIFHGRVVPFATVASELTFKLTGDQSVGGMNPSAFVLSLMEHPQQWAQKPFIKSKNGYVSVSSLYDSEGRYIPQLEYQGGDGPRDNELLQLDEKVSLLFELWSGELFSPAPEDSMRSHRSIRAEVLYVKIQPVKWFFMLLLTAGIITMFCRRVRAVSACLFAISLAIFVWQWWIRGYFPVASTGEVMYFAALCLCGCAMLISRRYPLAGSLALLMGGFAALLSWLAIKNPVMTPLMPVLDSPWLSIHVSLVMISYALLAMVSLMAFVSLFSQKYLSLSKRLLPVAVYLLGLGIIVGALWANVSWGRYWGWDPKETWALITFLIYAVPLHPFFRFNLRPRLLRFYLIFAFATVVMTYAGVNYLPSLHAYRV